MHDAATRKAVSPTIRGNQHIKDNAMISAKIIADSVSTHTGQRITTFELEYPRFIHAELMTHRVFSRNSSSSRAIPIQTMINHIKATTAMPIHWGKNKSGMQAKTEVEDSVKQTAMQIWLQARDDAISHAQRLAANGLHKQIVNRILEPFQMMKVVVTATSFDNWFSLRLHPDAQPEIHELAKAMYEAIQNSIPFELSYGEWHLPYIERQRDEEGEIKYFVYNTDEDPTSEAFGYQYTTPLTLEQAQKISCSCCAQVSYRKSDTSIAKSEVIYDKLVNSKPVHASAFEHCAAPIDIELRHNREFPKGITGIALDRTQPNNIATYLSGNFTNWIQYRQLIKDHDCKEFKKELNT